MTKAEDFLLGTLSPKIRQKVKLLEINSDFIKDVNFLRKKWKNLIAEYNLLEKKWINEVDRLGKKYHIPVRKDISEMMKLSEISTEKEEHHLLYFKKEQRDILLNKEIDKDIKELASKFKLFPVSIWSIPLIFFVITKEFLFGSNLLMPYPDEGEPTRINIKDLNFSIEIRRNPDTEENELLVQIFNDTSIGDIKKHWNLINEYKEKLKKDKGIFNKRYYPLKNLENYKKLEELDKDDTRVSREEENDNDMTSEKAYKLTDIEKAEEVYGEGVLRNKTKIENKLKQMRHQYKKKLKS